MRKLIGTDKIDLIYTLDGKEYLTHDQLQREVSDCVIEQGGRINVVDIPNHLNVSVDVIQQHLSGVQNKYKIQHINGQLISSGYID